jgi:peptide deformylase
LPFTIFINPEIEYLTNDKKGFWEGCLSVPGLRGFVLRPERIKVTYCDLNWQRNEIIAEGFVATVLQHELDHLEGILYVDKINDIKNLVYQEEYEQFILNSNQEII